MTEPKVQAVEVTQEDREAALKAVEAFEKTAAVWYGKPSHDGHWLTQAFARHRLASTPPTNAPSSDYVLVPREPTEAMLRNARAAWETLTPMDSVERHNEVAWSAMLAAAPSPPQADHVERVARAICFEEYSRKELISPWWDQDGPRPPNTISVSRFEKQNYREMARAAILALSPPAVADPGEGK